MERDFKQQMKDLDADIKVIERKKLGLITDNYHERVSGVNNNYKMGLITFNELLEQTADLIDEHQDDINFLEGKHL